MNKVKKENRMKGVVIIIVLLLSFGMLSVIRNTLLIWAEGTIYIGFDGTVSPSTAPIIRDGDTYTFTSNISGAIVIQRNNAVLDGMWYALEGDRTGYGFDLSNTRNITIKNTKISKFQTGIRLFFSFDIKLIGNVITQCVYGILPSNSPNSIMSSNIVMDNYWDGIFLMSSDGFILNNNTIANHNKWGLYLGSSIGIILRNNKIAGNRWNFGVSDSFVHDIDASNTIDGKPIYYLVNQHNEQVPTNAGYVAVVNSTNITIKGLNLTKNGQGMVLANSRNCFIEYSNFTKMGYYSILLFDSDDNVIKNNVIRDNKPPYFGVGIAVQNNSTGNIISNNIFKENEIGILFQISSGNKIYNNTFLENVIQAYTDGSKNVWDNGSPSGGNYWSDYNGFDQKTGPLQDQPGSDGIGDTSYTIDDYNQDPYPLMIPEFSPIIITLFFVPTTLLTVVIHKKKHSMVCSKS